MESWKLGLQAEGIQLLVPVDRPVFQGGMGLYVLLQYGVYAGWPLVRAGFFRMSCGVLWNVQVKLHSFLLHVTDFLVLWGVHIT